MKSYEALFSTLSVIGTLGTVNR